jgi:hypothetical protein
MPATSWRTATSARKPSWIPNTITLAYGDIRTEAVVDPEHDHYEVMQVGWQGDRRVHGSIIHIDIRDGKVWIEYNGTDARLGEELVAAGIPRHDIVLGFHPAEVRSLSGFGVG